MILAGVAGYTIEVGAVRAHMDIHFAAGAHECLFQVAVLHIVPASAKEVARSAVGALRKPDALRHEIQIDVRTRHARSRFGVRSAVVVADQAIDVARIFEIEPVVDVFVTGMALLTALKIARNTDAKVVQQILLADCANAAARQVDFARPVPVCRSHHFFVPFGVAGDANGRDFVRGSELLLQDCELFVVN